MKYSNEIEVVSLLNIIQHRLNNTLGIIRLLFNDIQDDNNVNTIHKKIKNIKSEIDKLYFIINQLSDYKKLPIKSNTVEKVNIYLLLNKLSKGYKYILKKQAITFKIDHNIKNIHIKANYVLLEEVFRNLIDNSIIAVSSEKNKKINIKKQNIDNKVLNLLLEDTGGGIKKEIKDNIFKLGVTSKIEHKGFGLWFVKSSIESIGGLITLNSSKKGMTKFIITLPLWIENKKLINYKEISKNVIIVEDDLEWTKLILNFLREMKINADHANTFVSATRMLKENTYDIAILDINLGSNSQFEHSGLELASLVRKNNPYSTIIIMTGYATINTVKKAFINQKVDHFIEKSNFTSNDFKNILYTAVRRRSTEVEAIRQDELSRFKYEMLGMISHELRSPIIDVQGYIENLYEGVYGKLIKKQKEILKISLESINRENRLIDGFLDLDRIESNLSRLNKTKCDLIKIIMQEVINCRKQTNAKKIIIKTKLSHYPVIIEGDEDRLKMVISNLLDNALKFSPLNSIVNIQNKIIDKTIEIQIIDQGPGIKADELDKVWEWRYRSKEVLTQRIRGSGLGLSICKRMVELHGGKIWIISEPKKGTTVNLSFPIK